MTVAELRKAIEGLPDAALVLVRDYTVWDRPTVCRIAGAYVGPFVREPGRETYVEMGRLEYEGDVIVSALYVD